MSDEATTGRETGLKGVPSAVLWWIAWAGTGGALIGGALLVVSGSDVLVGLAATIVGRVIGYAGFLVPLVLLALGSVSATEYASVLEDQHSREALEIDTGRFREAPARASRELDDAPLGGVLRRVVSWGFWFGPHVLALVGTLLAGQVLAGLDRPVLIGGLVIAIVVAGPGAVGARAVAAGTRRLIRLGWLHEHFDLAARDPEFAERLRREGFRTAGPYEEMRATYFRVWETLKAERRAAGRAIFHDDRRGDSPR